jgi:hypothetical protein
LLQLQQVEQQLAAQSTKNENAQEQQQHLILLQEKLVNSESMIEELRAQLPKKIAETAAVESSEPLKVQESKPEPEQVISADETPKKKAGLMGFFKKLDKSAEVIEPVESSEPLVAEKSEPEEIVQPEKTAKKSGNLTGFFKKLDKSAEIIAPVESSEPLVAEKPEPQSTVPPEKTAKKSGNLMGFFKKLDKSAEVIAPVESSEPLQPQESETEIPAEEVSHKSNFFSKKFKNISEKIAKLP